MVGYRTSTNEVDISISTRARFPPRLCRIRLPFMTTVTMTAKVHVKRASVNVDLEDDIKMDVIKSIERAWTGFVWLRMGTSGGIL